MCNRVNVGGGIETGGGTGLDWVSEGGNGSLENAGEVLRHWPNISRRAVMAYICSLKELEAVGHAVSGGDSRDGDGVMAYIDGVGDNYGLRFEVNGLLAEVVFERYTHPESILAAEIPGVVMDRFLVDDNWASQINEGGGVVVEGTVEVLPGRNFGVEGGLAKQVEQQLSLWKEMAAQVSGEAGGNAGENGD